MLSTTLIAPLEIAKLIFFLVYIGATVGVIVGVYWEGDRFPPQTQQRGWKLLVASLAVDTLFTVLVFGTDGWISAIQRNEIIALNRCLSARNLSNARQQRIADKLKPFEGTTFDNGIGPRGDPEPLYLVRSIHSALSRAGWIAIPWTGAGDLLTEPGMPLIGETSVTNVIIDVHPDRWGKLGAAATALAHALAAEGIEAIVDSRPTTINADAVHVRIGRKLCWRE